MINLEKAVELYSVLEPHLPIKEEEENKDSIRYVRKILDSIKENDPYAYTKSLHIMYGLEIEDLKKKEVEEILSLFIQGLIENKLVALKSFLGSLKYGR